jgi:hypothetical protein
MVYMGQNEMNKKIKPKTVFNIIMDNFTRPFTMMSRTLLNLDLQGDLPEESKKIIGKILPTQDAFRYIFQPKKEVVPVEECLKINL